MTDSTDPPVAKYRYTLTVTGNSHEEIENEIVVMTRGGYLLDSHYYERDEFTVYGGTSTRVLEHVNPDQTPESYSKELDEWFDRRRQERKEESR